MPSGRSGGRSRRRKRNKSSPLLESSPKKAKSQGAEPEPNITVIEAVSETDSELESQSLLRTPHNTADLSDTVDPTDSLTIKLPSTPVSPSTMQDAGPSTMQDLGVTQLGQDQSGFGMGAGLMSPVQTQPPIMNPALAMGVHPQMMSFQPAPPGLSELDVMRVAQLVKTLLQQEISEQVQIKVTEATQTLVTELAAAKSDIADLQKQCSDLRNELHNGIIDLQKKQDEGEQYQRRMCLRISGVRETKTEDVTKKVLEFAKIVDSRIALSDIDRAHRVGPSRFDVTEGGNNVEFDNPNDDAKSREIIIKFTNSSARLNLLQGRTALRNKNIKNVFINEDLTPARKLLAFECRRIKRLKNSKITRTWIYAGFPHILDSDGNKIKITCMSDLKAYDVKEGGQPSGRPMNM